MSIQQDWVPPESVLELLRAKGPLKTREIAEELDTSFIAAQNALHELFMADRAEVIRPTKLEGDGADKRWRASDGR